MASRSGVFRRRKSGGLSRRQRGNAEQLQPVERRIAGVSGQARIASPAPYTNAYIGPRASPVTLSRRVPAIYYAGNIGFVPIAFPDEPVIDGAVTPLDPRAFPRVE